MRILYIHQHFSTPHGLTGTRSYEFARKLVEEGHEVHMLCGSNRITRTGLEGAFHAGVRRGRVDGIEVIELDLPYRNAMGLAARAVVFARFAWRSLGIALREPCDLVFATSTPLTVAIPAIAAKLLRRKPFVFEVRDVWPELPKAMGVIRNPLLLGALGSLERAAYRAADRIVALSGGMAESIQARGIPIPALAVIPNGCDLELFSPNSPMRVARADARAYWGIDEDKFVALFAGAHGMANGLDAVLDAAAVLQKSDPASCVRFLFVGDGKEKLRLVARAAREDLRNCIFADPVPKHELARTAAAFDVGLQVLANVPAFYRGTSPNKFFDYLAMGLPVVTNYPGWVAELVEGEGCGIVVPPSRATAFAASLQELAAAPERARRLGQASRALGEREFDRAQLARRFIEFVCHGKLGSFVGVASAACLADAPQRESHEPKESLPVAAPPR